MAGIHGKAVVFKWNAVALTGVTDVSGLGVANASVADTTAMGDSATSSQKGIPDGGTFTVSGLAAHGTTDINGLGTAANDNSATAAKAFLYQPEGTAVGNGQITGTAYVVGFTHTASFGGAVKWTAKFQVTGAVIFGVQ